MIEILIIGELLVEIMRPKKGIPLDKKDIFKGPFPSGAPAIFIDTAANLGHKSAIIGGVGNDGFGKLILSKLEKDGVETTGIKISKLPTGVAFVSYFEDGSRKFIFHIRDSAASDLGNLDENLIKNIKVFHIMGVSLMIKESVANKIVDTARKIKKYGGIVSFDPNIRKELMNKPYIEKAIHTIIGLSFIILPGLEELLLITSEHNKEAAIKKALDNAHHVVLKLGSKGCEIYSRDKEDPVICPSLDIGVKVVDPTGAGDAFDAGFLCGLLEEKSMSDCGILANACGALNTTKLGPMEGVFKRDRVNEFIKINS
ncbi:MAG: sugar kinase [Actinobacteria bacterium]|nr:sugar kinase [Actinomycetota bacterium]MCL5771595.1 sugar kinase [Actinomycetota bacterium]